MSTKTATLFVFVVATAMMLSACTLSPQSKKSNTSTEMATPQPTPSPTSSSETSGSPMTNEQSVKEDSKTVSVTESYQSPAGQEEVGFTLTVDKSGLITDATTQVMGKAPASKIRQEAFAKEMPTVLKGKKLSELTTIDRVGGSSLTTGAFNKALANLKAQL